MRYLLKDIVIFEGTFQRGTNAGQKYRWLRAAMYNEGNFRANPRQLPLYFAFNEDEVNMYLPYAKPDPQRLGAFNVNPVDVKAAIEKGEVPDLLHIDDVYKITIPLSTPYARIYNAQIKDAQTGQVLHEKGDFVIAEGQTEPVPVNEITLHLVKIRDNQDPTLQTWREDPAREVRNLLERSYKPYVPKSQAQTAPTVAAPESPDAGEVETPEQKAERLKAELAALGQS